LLIIKIEVFMDIPHLHWYTPNHASFVLEGFPFYAPMGLSVDAAEPAVYTAKIRGDARRTYGGRSGTLSHEASDTSRSRLLGRKRDARPPDSDESMLV
jgi:hypothetical protein